MFASVALGRYDAAMRNSLSGLDSLSNLTRSRQTNVKSLTRKEIVGAQNTVGKSPGSLYEWDGWYLR